MKTARLILLVGAALLVAATLSGCLRRSQPQALFTASNREAIVPFTVAFDATLSYASRGQIDSYLWTFGDGASETGPVVEHTYNEDGIYEVRLIIVDDSGVSTSTVMTIHALNPPPTAGFTYSPKSHIDGDYFVACNETVTFDAEEHCSDDGTIVAYDWYFGYRNNDGTAAEASGPVVTHEFLYAGTYNIILTVTDNDGGTATFEEKLDVKGGPPCNADITGDVPWESGGGTCQ